METSVFAASIVKILYGIDIQDSDDPYISLAEIVLNGLAQVRNPGSFLVDTFPTLKYVPSWFPGAGFKRKAAYLREVAKIVFEKPFRHVEEQLVRRAPFFMAHKLVHMKNFCRKMAKLGHPLQQL